jgi:hypothetical protein
MLRRNLELKVAAAQGALAEGERVDAYGQCWAVRRRRFLPLAVLARRRVLLLVTDRRLLVFARPRSRNARSTDLLIGKRFETYRLERVRRVRPLLQLRLTATSGERLVFEFGPRGRELAGALAARLNGSSGTVDPPRGGPGSGEAPAFWEPPSPPPAG